MAPRILPEYGFDPSCGNFEVKVVQKQLDSSAIQVEYSQLIDSDRSFYRASLPWNGGDISVTEVETLLNSAKVPSFIQFVSAIDMVLRFVDQTLKQSKEASSGLPSVLVKIWSDMETIDSNSEFEVEE